MDVEEEIPERKDASRPFLNRKEGEAGIYIDVIDAVSVDPKKFGLEHARMMDIKEKFHVNLCSVNLVNIKGSLEHRGLFKGVILEEVRDGSVLVVTFDTKEAVEGLWKLFQKDKLSPMFQELLVNKETMNECEVTWMKIRAKLWEDEYTNCLEEVGSRSSTRVGLDSHVRDKKLLQEIRTYQKTLGDHTLHMRDMELEFERNVDNFMIAGRRILPENETIVHSLGDFRKSTTIAKGDKKAGLEVVEKYFETLDKIKRIYIDVERNVCYRLCQIHGVCETEEQRELKDFIIKSRKNVMDILRPDHNLLKVRFSDWEIKVDPREKKLFFGLVSVIPLALETLIDIDHSIDSYITMFPDQAAEN